jgi:hypothetical protein
LTRKELIYLALTSAAFFHPAGDARSQTIPIEPVTGEIQVNTYSTGDQGAPSVAVDGDGDFVVVWESESDAYVSVPGILAQRFDSAGAPAGNEFRVSLNTLEDNLDAAVAMGEGGDFVVVWAGPGYTPGSKILVGKRFDSAGGSIETFQANEQTAGGVRSAAVTLAGDGGFVVAWDDESSPGSDGDGRSVHARLFDSLGDPRGGQFQVNAYTTGDQAAPAVAADGDGDFVVVWESETYTGSAVRSIVGRRFDSGGTAQGDEFLINTDTTEDNLDAAVAMGEGGDFVVVWAGRGYLPASKILLGKRYDSAGNQVGVFVANGSTIAGVRSAAVAIDRQGRFLVTWDDVPPAPTDGDGRSVRARLYGADGVADGSPFQVNTFTTGDQRLPAVAVGGERVVVAWESAGPDGDGTAVRGQVYGLGIFTDGFESGDVSAWSPSSR